MQTKKMWDSEINAMLTLSIWLAYINLYSGGGICRGLETQTFIVMPLLENEKRSTFYSDHEEVHRQKLTAKALKPESINQAACAQRQKQVCTEKRVIRWAGEKTM